MRERRTRPKKSGSHDASKPVWNMPNAGIPPTKLGNAPALWATAPEHTRPRRPDSVGPRRRPAQADAAAAGVVAVVAGRESLDPESHARPHASAL